MRPELEARQAAFRKAESEGTVGSYEKHDDFIQWLMDEHRARGNEVTPDELVQNIFITMVASMHGTSSIGYSVLLDLLAHPDALADIKEEISRTKKVELQGEQVWTRHALGELRLLDSFMRETHRMHPFTEATMQRTVIVPYTFKDVRQLHLAATQHGSGRTWGGCGYLRPESLGQQAPALRYQQVLVCLDLGRLVQLGRWAPRVPWAVPG